MTQIVVLPHHEICPEGAVVEGESGVSICEALLQAGLDIEHACEMSCACERGIIAERLVMTVAGLSRILRAREMSLRLSDYANFYWRTSWPLSALFQS